LYRPFQNYTLAVRPLSVTTNLKSLDQKKEIFRSVLIAIGRPYQHYWDVNMHTQKAFVLIMVFFSIGTLCCQAGPPAALSGSDRAAISKVIDEALALANATEKDWAEYARTYYASDAVVMPPNTTAIKGHEAIASFFETFTSLTEAKFETIEMDGAGDIAYVWAKYSLTMSPTDAETPTIDTGKFIEIWRKQEDGTWLVALDIFNSDLPLPDVVTSQTEE
jgi:ketosteroid isomerase-like protein